MEQVLGRSSEDVLSQPVVGGPSLTTTQRREIDLSGTIRGWGSDVDRDARPGVPMDLAPGVGVDTLYPPIEQQVPRGRVHKSTEHGRMPPVFGNACPPRGLSGLIRDVAYGYSEGRVSHWLLLMLADRVDVVEEAILDLARLTGPNVPKERGWKAELTYNRKAVAKQAAIAGVGLLAVYALTRARTHHT